MLQFLVTKNFKIEQCSCSVCPVAFYVQLPGTTPVHKLFGSGQSPAACCDVPASQQALCTAPSLLTGSARHLPNRGSAFTTVQLSIRVLLFGTYLGNSFSFFDSASQ